MMYSWIKAFHIASVMTWVGGMLIMALALQVMQRSLLERPSEARPLQAVRRWDQRVTSPALGLAWIFGVALVYFGQWHAAGWLVVKLVFVLILSALHGMQSAYLRRLAEAPEVSAPATPALLKNSGLLTIVAVVAIAVMVVLKPF